jgi:WD40 repeat protein/tRNA A-37 threonylcarbamoyl transferase component Bud32
MATDFQRVQSVFQAVAELPPAERAAVLERECQGDAELVRRIQALLKAHDDSRELPAAEPETTDGSPRTPPELAPTAEPGQLFAGRYKLREKLGEGGMGVVFVAEQTEPVQRRVALKIIRADLDTHRLLARFEQERQALALMDHPNIAKVFDAGVDQAQRPYFVMELVKGLPLTKYCDDARLSPRQRLELFIPVCQAVQHAHQKGIIHRDLKPSNILVGLYDGRPVPKVIDFGVAKATGPRLTEQSVYTEVGSLIGTLEYMSPEQAERNNLDIDTRSDIYALGVVLYELLTGAVPFSRKELERAGLAEMLRIIKEAEPPRPSTKLSHSGTLPNIAAQRQMEPRKLTALVRGELDWIVMKALEKDRNRRYETANGFGADVQRYLNDEAVQACPPSARYRLRKFVRKYWKPLGAVGTFVALLVAATVAAVLAAVQSSRLAETEHDLRNTADRKADGERKAKQELEWNLYLQRVARAQQELLAGNTGRAEELLEDCPDYLRGWEWHYLKRSRPGNPLLLRGNFAAAFSPDHSFLAAPVGAKVDIVNLATGKKWRTLGGNTSFIERWGVAFYPKSDEAVLAVAEYNGKVVRLWNTDTGKEIRTLGGHGDRIRMVAFSPDGQRLAVGSIEGGVKFWDWKAGRLLFELPRPPAISRVAFSPDSRRIAVGVWGTETAISIRDADSGRELRSFGRHSAGIEGVAYSPNGERVASSSADGDVKIWDESTGELRLTLAGHHGPVNDVAYAPDGRRIATAGWDKTIKIWDTETGNETLTLRGHAEEVKSVAFSPDGRRLVSTWRDRVGVWNATPVDEALGLEAFRVPGHASSVASVAFSPNGRFLASAGEDRLIHVWEVDSLGRGIEPRGKTLKGHLDRVLSLAFSPDSRRLVSAGIDGIKVWDTARGKELWTAPPNGGWPLVAFSPDGLTVAVLCSVSLNFRNAETGEPVATLRMHTGGLGGFAYSPDGKLVAVGNERYLRIWDLGTAKEVRSVRHDGAVWHVAYSPDGRRIASACFDQTVRIWNATDGKEIHTLRGHTDRVLCVAFSPDGKRLASAGGDSTVKVWDAATGRELGTLHGHSGYIWSVAFSPDGKRVASGGGHHARGEVKIWDVTQWDKLPDR